ncbi:hypothetical protein KUCAC02_021820 [Chaenocephalus aceratus]|uniref:Uncharacterized protein n=1 Tax=Chaenocephalus aceratus TaxID=36190 RepID=A0ACB9XIK5_CHAAC|nr:hypothetical protein KUCAC02_021820 [Chaenocephalus aceratus]
MSRTSLETQKLDLMDEVSFLKLKLCVVNLISDLQEQMCRFQEEISTRIQEKRALEEREARQGEPRGPPGRSLGAGSVSSDLSLAASDPLRPDGGQNYVLVAGSTVWFCFLRCLLHVEALFQGMMMCFTRVKQLKREVEGLQGEKGQYERKLRATKWLVGQLSSLQLKVEHMQQLEESWRSAQVPLFPPLCCLSSCFYVSLPLISGVMLFKSSHGFQEHISQPAPLPSSYELAIVI